MLKVMIVEDQARKMSHCDNLIDWNKNGYEIVAKKFDFTSAKLYCVDNVVDIVLVNTQQEPTIVLAFCEEISSLPYPPYVIFLLEKYDADYLQHILQISTASFILKNEMNSDKLIVMLKKIKTNNEKGLQIMGIVRNRLLHSILKGKKAWNNEIQTALQINNLKKVKFVFLHIRRDIYFPILPFTLDKHYYEVSWHSTHFPEKYQYIATAEIQPDIWGMLIKMPCDIGQNRFYEDINIIANSVQSNFHSQFFDTVSIAYSDMLPKLDNLPEVCEELSKKTRLSIYYGKAKIYRYNQPYTTDKNYKEIINRGIFQLSQNINSSKIVELSLNLSSLFSNFVLDRYGYEGFNYLCDELVKLLDNYRISNCLPSLGELFKRDEINFTNCFTVSKVNEWFVKEFANAILTPNKILDGQYSGKVQDIIKYINSNFEKNFSINELAEKFKISSDYLRHVFKKETGKTILNFITNVKIQNAKRLLSLHTLKIGDVAKMTGFSSAQYFSYVFKKSTGSIPTDY